MDAGRHKTPVSNTKGFIILGTMSSMSVMFASVLHTPISTGQHSEGQMTSMYGVGYHRRGAWTKETHISYYEKHAHPLLQREMLSLPSKAVRNLLFLWRETLSLSSKAVYYRNILEKITWNKATIVFGDKMGKNARKQQWIVSQ